MKNIILYLIASLVVLSIFQSCKKGDNDPLIALQTRKARLVNHWKAEKIERKIDVIYTNVDDTDSTITQNIIFENNYEVNTTAIQGVTFDTTFIDSMLMQYEIKINKDGSYVQDIIDQTNYTIETIEGNWIFLGKSEKENLKNKEAILLTTTKRLTSDGTNTNIINYTDLDGVTIVLDRLKNDELITVVEKSFIDDTGLQSGTYYEKITYKKK